MDDELKLVDEAESGRENRIEMKRYNLTDTWSMKWNLDDEVVPGWWGKAGLFPWKNEFYWIFFQESLQEFFKEFYW